MNRKFPSTLRVRITLGVALPMLLGLGGLSVWQHYREELLLQEQMKLWATHIGEIIAANLEHAMQTHDNEMISNMFDNVAELSDVSNIKLIDNNFVVYADSIRSNQGEQLEVGSAGCVECHQYSVEGRPRVVANISNLDRDLVRIVTPIKNAPACVECHDANSEHIGILLIDVSEAEQKQAIRQNFMVDISWSFVVTLAVSLWVYFNINRLVTRRLIGFAPLLEDFAGGDLSVRLPISKEVDELDGLAAAFNQMAGELKGHIEESEQRKEALQQAIIEERTRIARELHDSLPQLLAYFIAKIGAIRLLLGREKKGEALENLDQLESASRRLFTDVREAIIGLRMSRRIVDGLAPAVRDYIDQFTHLCGLPVIFSTDPQLLQLNLDPETQIHALRIVQEALSNVRKHAMASQARVELKVEDEKLKIVIQDNGRGFDLDAARDNGVSHFGLHTMRERAESVGGIFKLVTSPGQGTLITIILPIPEID